MNTNKEKQMKTTIQTGTYRCIKPALALLAIVAMTCISQGVPVGFSDDFNDGVLDPAWTQGSYAAGHLGEFGGQYWMTAKQGGGFNPKLQRFGMGGAGAPDPYINEITVNFDTFFLTGSGGTQSDIKFKNFGSDGFMELVLNSFGDMRLYHNNSTAGVGGNIQPNTNIGIAEGDVLGLKTVYNPGTDTIDVTYSLNGGAAIPFYSGTGSAGSIGNVIGNFVEVEIFKWGAVPDEPFAGIDEWNLTVIPEPATLGLIGLSTVGIYFARRRFLA